MKDNVKILFICEFQRNILVEPLIVELKLLTHKHQIIFTDCSHSLPHDFLPVQDPGLVTWD